MPKLVLRLPEELARKVEEAAEGEDMLPTEYVRQLLREELNDTDSGDETDESNSE